MTVSDTRSVYRILHLCWEYPPVGSGVGQYIKSITAGLRALGHFSLIVTTRGEGLPETEELPNGKILRIYDVGDIGSQWLADKVLEISERERIDLIESPDRLGEAGVLLKNKLRPPILINCRYNDVLRQARYAQAYYPWQKIMIELSRLRQWKLHRRERYCIEHADLLAAPSRIMLEGLKNQGVSLPEKTAVLPKPLIPLSEWENEEAERPTVLFLGRIDMGKGIGYLPGMIQEVSALVPDVLFEIGGGDSYARGLGSCREWLEKKLTDKKDAVRFLGHLNREEVNEAFRRAWVVIVPSRWDTSPTTVLEAMQRKKPIVASPFGGMPEYMKGTANHIADPDTQDFSRAVADFLLRSDTRREAGETGLKKTLEAFLPEICAGKYIHFIEQGLTKITGERSDLKVTENR